MGRGARSRIGVKFFPIRDFYILPLMVFFIYNRESINLALFESPITQYGWGFYKWLIINDL